MIFLNSYKSLYIPKLNKTIVVGSILKFSGIVAHIDYHVDDITNIYVSLIYLGHRSTTVGKNDLTAENSNLVDIL